MHHHNSLIATQTEDTLLNIHALLTFIEEVHTAIEFNDSVNQHKINGGLSLIVKCTNEALNFEIEKLNKQAKESKGTIIMEA